MTSKRRHDGGRHQRIYFNENSSKEFQLPALAAHVFSAFRRTSFSRYCNYFSVGLKEVQGSKTVGKNPGRTPCYGIQALSALGVLRLRAVHLR